MGEDHNVAIVGAGPYALATAAHLKAAGVEHRIFGEAMGFWKTMPEGMFLRSYRHASSIGAPDGALSIEEFERERGRPVPLPTPLTDFVAYGQWVASRAAPSLEDRRVTKLARQNGGFALELEDGESFTAKRVVLATGIGPFAWKAPELAGLPEDVASHSSEHRTFERFRGQKVAIVGGGQSALEVSALAHEAGADVDTFIRRSALHYLRGEQLYHRPVLGRVLYPSLGVGPPGLNWVMGTTSLYRVVPRGVRAPMARRAIRPAGAAWLRQRLENVRLHLGRRVLRAEVEGGGVRLDLDNGERHAADHVIIATGYRVDIRRYPFLDDALREEIRVDNGFPVLSAGFESSAPGLHFAGASAASSAGPGMRFVSHSGVAAAAITAKATTNGGGKRS